MSKARFFALLAIALVTACADTTQLVREPGKATIRLTGNDAVYIAVPRDGFYGDENYQGSGLSTAQAFLSAFAKRARRVEVATSYLVYPTILHWEERATEWSGLPDRIEVKVELVDVATDTPLDTGIIKGK